MKRKNDTVYRNICEVSVGSILLTCLILSIILITALIMIKKNNIELISLFPEKNMTFTLKDKKIQIHENESISINALLRDEIKDEMIKVISANNNIVKIENGKINGVSKGKTNIYTMINGVISDKIEIECIKRELEVVVIELEEDKILAQEDKENELEKETNITDTSNIEQEIEYSYGTEQPPQQPTQQPETTDINSNVTNESVNYTEPEKPKPVGYIINNVPFYNQLTLGYPMGCEAVSATMAARYANYDVSIEDIINNTPTDERGIWKEYVEDENGRREVIFGGDPFEVFVGHPTRTGKQGSYGCFAQPIIIALRSLGIPCRDVSGCSEEELLKYIEEGTPVIVWGTAGGKNIIYQETWTYPDYSGTFTKLKGEHCMVLIGYDKNYVYLNDPVISAKTTQSRTKFFKNWDILYRQAVIIEF